jgi:hydrogenase-4 component B
MPVTALAFILAGAAISGLPPGNAFFGELLIYVGGGIAALDLPLPSAGYAWACVAGLALIGGLSVIGFTRASGIVFLGEPRTDDAANAHDPDLSMRAAMVFLAACAAIAALASAGAFPLLLPAVRPLLAGQSPDLPPRHLSWSIPRPCFKPPCGSRPARRPWPWPWPWSAGGFWPGPGPCRRDPGHLGLRLCQAPPRMQYTASSYAEPMTAMFRRLLGEKRRFAARGFSRPATAVRLGDPDRIRDGCSPPVRGHRSACDAVKGFQHGNLNLYILYVLATLVILLAFSLEFFA